MTVITGKEAIMELFRQEGVEYVFGIPGATEVVFMDALEDHPEIKYILGLHEVVALGMAEGYSRISGKVGVVNLHTWAGLAASTPMLLNAHLGGVPLVVTAGQQDTRLLMQEPDLAGNLVGLASQFTKWSTEVSHAADIPVAMRRAFKVAAQSPTGPVFVSLPQNLLDQSLDFENLPTTPAFARLRPDQEAINRAVELLIKAQTPLMIVGRGITKDEALSEIVKLAELIGAPVYHQWMGEVNFPTSHPQYLGDLDVLSSSTREMLRSVDALVVAGAPLFRHPFYLPEPLLTTNTKIIQIDNDPWQIAKNFPVAAGLVGNIKMSLTQLNEALENRMPEPARQAAKTRAKDIAQEKETMAKAFLEEAWQEKDQVPISASRLMQELKGAVKPDTIVVDDCWSPSGTLRRSLDFDEPMSYQRAAGGSIGWGVSGCLGAKLAAPDRPVVAVIGDGCAMWAIQSLWTAAHYNIPVTYLVCANASYEQVKIMKHLLMGEKAKGRYLGMELDEPRIDFCQLAQGMGIPGQKVEQPEELRKALKSALESDRPNLVEVYIARAL
ncbi:Benzoylformate decarboxylase [subsurface metagenome]